MVDFPQPLTPITTIMSPVDALEFKDELNKISLCRVVVRHIFYGFLYLSRLLECHAQKKPKCEAIGYRHLGSLVSALQSVFMADADHHSRHQESFELEAIKSKMASPCCCRVIT